MSPLPRSQHLSRLSRPGSIAITADDAARSRGRWRTDLQATRTILEIGCFDARLLSSIAADHPTTAFVGIDWKCRPLCDASDRLQDAPTSNLRLVHATAADLPHLFAPHELSEIWIFHPEPCVKPNDRHNRLLTSQFLASAHEFLTPAGHLVIKTDHPGYYQWLLGLLALPAPTWFAPAHRNPSSPKVHPADLFPPTDIPPPSPDVLSRFNLALRSDDLWNDPIAQAALANRPFANRPTPYESRFRTKRQPIFLLDLTKR